MSEAQREYSPQKVRELKEALHRTDISLFGFLFDHHFVTLQLENPGLTTGEYEQRALQSTIGDSIIQRVGIDKVVEAFKGGKYGTEHFSDRSKSLLNKLIAEREAQELLPTSSPAQK